MSSRRAPSTPEADVLEETAALGRAVELAGRMRTVANSAAMQALWAIVVEESDRVAAKRARARFSEDVQAFAAYLDALTAGDDALGVPAALARRLGETTLAEPKIQSALGGFVERARSMGDASDDEATDVDAARRLVEMASGPVAAALETVLGALSGLLADSTRDRDKQAAATRKLTEETVENLKDLTVRIQLIAVNASVEAARVGQAGAGFGVIAHEITTLAKNAQSAIDQISKGLAGARA